MTWVPELAAIAAAIGNWVSAGVVTAGPIGTAAFLISLVLAAIKIAETMRDRVRLAVNFLWTGQQGAADVITVANVGARPLLVSHWALELRRPFAIWARPKDVTPNYDYDADLGFRLDPHSKHKIEIDDDDKVDHRLLAQRERVLYIKLYLYGRSRPKCLRLSG